MTNIIAALLVVSAGALDPGGAASSSIPFKCAPRVGGDPGMPETAIIIDHEPFEGDVSSWFEDHEDDVYWGEIVCWRWVEEHLGIRIRQGATYVLTRKWVEDTLQAGIASLEALIAAQDRYHRAHGSFADDLRFLSGFGAFSSYGLPEYLRLELQRTEGGWGARLEASESWLTAFRYSSPIPPCYAFVGTPPAEWDDWKGIGTEGPGDPIEGQPTCVDRYAEDEARPEGS